MKKKWKIVLLVLLSIVLIVGAVLVKTVLDMQKQLKDIDKTPVDISTVADGTYEGEYKTTLVKAKVSVSVEDGSIREITILEHECGQGKPAENMIPEMVSRNDVEVDAVSSATVSSEVIKAAVRDALRKGVK